MSKAPCFLSYFLLTLRKKKYFGEFEKKKPETYQFSFHKSTRQNTPIIFSPSLSYFTKQTLGHYFGEQLLKTPKKISENSLENILNFI